jgi:hypothetical protein
MTELQKIFSVTRPDEKPELRIDWDNDRHLAVVIAEPTPESVAFALRQATLIIESDIKKGLI